MKRMTAIVALLLAAAWMLQGVDLPKVKAVPLPRPAPLYNFEVQGIKRIVTTPSRVVFQVQYYISPTYPKACFIGAGIPNAAHPSSSFGLVPAGRLPDGVAKGQKHFTDNITFEMKYIGGAPFTSSAIEVFIYDADRVTKASALISWGQKWTRFDIQGLKRVTTRPEYVKFQVQYFIDPAYTQPCFISARVPDQAHENSHFSYLPAGTIPSGVRKGQVHFTDNVWFDVAYSGATPFTSSTIEVQIYNSTGTLYSQIINWGQTWSTAVY